MFRTSETAEKAEKTAKEKSKDDQLTKKHASDGATANMGAKQRADDLAEARRAGEVV
jgi:hypothetical protein